METVRDESAAGTHPAAGLKPVVEWNVVEVRVIGDRLLWVKFADGTSGEVHLARLIDAADAGVFAALRDERLLARAFVEQGAVTWPGEIDLAPDAMYDAIRATGSWTP